MAIYRWQGVSPRGETISGEMEAATRDAVLARLRAQRIQPIPAKIRERGKGLDREIALPGLGEKVKTRDVVVFTRQFGTMIDAGLPIVQCLDILASQTENKKFRRHHPPAEGRRRSRLDLHRGAAQAHQGLRRPVRQHDLRRRDRRYPRHHPPAPLGLHGKVHEAEGEDQGRDDLPGDHHHRRHRRHRRAADLGHPGVRRAVLELRSGAAGADAVRHQPVQLHHRLLPLPDDRLRHRRGGRAALLVPDRERAHGDGPRRCCRCRCSAI